MKHIIMALPNQKSKSENICRALKKSQVSFHELVSTQTEEDIKRPSLNSGWNNGEVLAHILFGFVILNALLPVVRIFAALPAWIGRCFASLLNLIVGPFNWINAIGARLQGRVFAGERLRRMYDDVVKSLLHKAAGIKEREWEQGMYYPTKWDSNFPEFMTIEKLFQYPVTHQQFHLKQISGKRK